MQSELWRVKARGKENRIFTASFSPRRCRGSLPLDYLVSFTATSPTSSSGCCRDKPGTVTQIQSEVERVLPTREGSFNHAPSSATSQPRRFELPNHLPSLIYNHISYTFLTLSRATQLRRNTSSTFISSILFFLARLLACADNKHRSKYHIYHLRYL